MLGTATWFKNTNSAPQPLHREILAQREHCMDQLLHKLYNLEIDPYPVSRLSGSMGSTLIFWYEYDWYECGYMDISSGGYGSSELETMSTLMRDYVHCQFSIADPDYYKDLSNSIYSQQQLERLDNQLNQQGVSLDLLRSQNSFDSVAIPPIWSDHIPGAAVYDFAASTGFLPDAKPFTSFMNSALHLDCINPFRDVCFVSDRPQFKRDSQDRLHAVGEPAIQFPDRFGLGTFYRTHLRSQEGAASRFSMSLTKQRLSLVVA
jgi:hypothetical protein